MFKSKTVGSGLLLLVLAGAVGYGIGLGLDALVNGSVKYAGSVPFAFALLFAVTAFFFGL